MKPAEKTSSQVFDNAECIMVVPCASDLDLNLHVLRKKILIISYNSFSGLIYQVCLTAWIHVRLQVCCERFHMLHSISECHAERVMHGSLGSLNIGFPWKSLLLESDLKWQYWKQRILLWPLIVWTSWSYAVQCNATHSEHGKFEIWLGGISVISLSILGWCQSSFKHYLTARYVMRLWRKVINFDVVLCSAWSTCHCRRCI